MTNVNSCQGSLRGSSQGRGIHVIDIRIFIKIESFCLSLGTQIFLYSWKPLEVHSNSKICGCSMGVAAISSSALSVSFYMLFALQFLSFSQFMHRATEAPTLRPGKSSETNIEQSRLALQTNMTHFRHNRQIVLNGW